MTPTTDVMADIPPPPPEPGLDVDATPPTPRISTVLEFQAEDWFEDDSPTLQWCQANADWHHQHACEFMVWVAWESEERFQNFVDQAAKEGCHPAFCAALMQAREQGAKWALFFMD